MLRPALAALLGAVLLLPGGAAFDPRPGGPHDDVTRAAARVAGFPEGGVDALVEAVRAPDVKDMSGPEDFSDVYEPAHHCDRVPPATDGEAFNATASYVRFEGDAARNASLSGDAAEAVRALGRALHALEDCFSHSNAVDLPEPMGVVHAVVGQVAPPAALRLSSVQPGAADPMRPDGDNYTHEDFAKDRADANDESALVLPDNRTKFEAARDLATDAATLFLSDWLGQRNPAEIGPLGDVDAPDGGPLPRWAPAPVGLALGAGLLVASASVRRRM
jgi:hypothetical protein